MLKPVFSGATGALRYALHAPDPTPAGHFGEAVAGVPALGGEGFSSLCPNFSNSVPNSSLGHTCPPKLRFVFTASGFQTLNIF